MAKSKKKVVPKKKAPAKAKVVETPKKKSSGIFNEQGAEMPA